MNYLIHLLIYFDIYLIVALSLNLVVGYCGMLTLAHAGYYAIGGYAYALLALVWGWGFLPAVLAAMLIAAVLSLAVSLPAWRLKGDFFILASLAVQVLIFSLLYNWSDANAPLGSPANLTNGPFGIPGIPKAEILGFRLAGSHHFFLLATGMAALCAFVIRRLTDSPWGRVLVSMREDELAARGLGKNTRFLKVQAIAIASGLAALAGTLYAAYVGYLDPSAASLEESILMLSMVLVGGVGNFRGPIIGASILITLPELLRFMDFPDAQAANIRLAIYGLMLVLMMHFRPQGIGGEYRLN
uniref:Branched-chain amino acid transport system permease protein n=1 Tax=Candidatus Kentrum sp. FM TaxID=2126340 RepID=A0A450TDW1_9GAMM|nr:MAG: branched-chain amino acid transport system permease protein [Candidatus Kentron sp. FM]VFJ65992.1 MAG: branched-chain amino acid transport system permease protein [Candidatus Kentron sp. FM]VFK15865.1 MAG: branched-chain amino acid transport system permease protein [Candidatus Kentron sp. FM]